MARHAPLTGEEKRALRDLREGRQRVVISRWPKRQDEAGPARYRLYCRLADRDLVRLQRVYTESPIVDGGAEFVLTSAGERFA